ncbi:MAG TPA: ASKHA domain-containing protein [Candidatus Limnocylindrales bacterium]|nr:ASKHA domain-containing protein [Candidatus Limnocylindrales bacterium]
MSSDAKIELLPRHLTLSVPRGAPLQDFLFAQGVEFPCGGRGRCKGCRIKVLAGSLPITEEDRQRLAPDDLAQGWRLACRAHAEGDLKIDLAQWEAAILTDDSAFAFTPRTGLGVAIDLGTTTLVAQLLDLSTGAVLAVRTALNAQAKHGADVMSRVEFAVAGENSQQERLPRFEPMNRGGTGGLAPSPPPEERAGERRLFPAEVHGNGQRQLQAIIHDQLRVLIEELLAEAPPTTGADLKSIVIVGNTVMHHLFCGIDLEPLSHYPFEPVAPGLQLFSAGQLGWPLPGDTVVHFLPCLGGFVGSDILAGILACKLHQRDSLAALVDLGTNGEIVVGNRERLLCASTAAGPAFEGARISMGMRAASGAISEVHQENGKMHCHVLGNAPPRGICGSGLVDAAASGLDLGWLRPNGRFSKGDSMPLCGPVFLNQWDIRELQLAKGAIAAGIRLLLSQWGAALGDVKEVFLAGAFGNYINYASARRIGLLEFAPDSVRPAGNTALLGAKMALFELETHRGAYPDILARTTHVSLNEDPTFHEIFVEQMQFPG